MKQDSKLISPETLQSISNFAGTVGGCSVIFMLFLLPQIIIAGTFAYRSLRKWLCYPYWSPMVEGYIWPHTAMLGFSLSFGLTYPNFLKKRYGDKRFEVQKSVSKPLARYLFILLVASTISWATMMISYAVFELFNQKP